MATTHQTAPKWRLFLIIIFFQVAFVFVLIGFTHLHWYTRPGYMHHFTNRTQLPMAHISKNNHPLNHGLLTEKGGYTMVRLQNNTAPKHKIQTENRTVPIDSERQQDYPKTGRHSNWGPHKLCVIVPLKDRFEELMEFLPHIDR